MERLQKVIASTGLTSRRKAEDLIKNGKVKVNGKIGSQGCFTENRKVDILLVD